MGFVKRIIFIGMLAFATQFSSLQASVELSSNWKFIKKDVPINEPIAHWENVEVPHTYNAKDAQKGGLNRAKKTYGYYRGPAWYANRFYVDSQLNRKRIFVRFEAVSIVADVYINGVKLGQHRGAFGAFAFELTKYIKFGQENELRVRSDNSWFEDIPPLSGDFCMFGGIYRPVELLVKEQVCINPLQNGSHGVFLRQQNVTSDTASLSIKTLLDNANNSNENIAVEYELKDHAGKRVGLTVDDQNVSPRTSSVCSAVLNVENPHLWDGRNDPYLYDVIVTLKRNGKILETYVCKQGFRYFRVDPKKGFFLNGKPYQLWGTNRHQDVEDIGWALINKDHDRDIDLIDEMGTRSLRLAHYPQSEYFIQRCDEKGILVTAELTLVNEVRNTKLFFENTILQMNEIVDLYGNYTSVFAYGLYNEIYHKKSDHPGKLLNQIHQLCKKRDATRLTYGGTNQGPHKPELNLSTDLLAFNGYQGWYGGQSHEIEKWVNIYNKAGGYRGIGISEYGAGASVKQHETYPKKPRPGGKWHPENYQAQHHEKQFEIMKKTPHVWGTYVWNMFDFASSMRDEGDRKGINDKGLVTRDRQTRKDAFYFYKANWSKQPVLYIASRRHAVRGEKQVPVKVYSNVGDVTLTVNGKLVSRISPNDMNIVMWDSVSLNSGTNVIRVAAGKNEDQCTWTVQGGYIDPARSDVEIEGDDPKLVFDRNMKSRWTTNKRGVVLEWDFLKVIDAKHIAIAWYKGDQRKYSFNILVSKDKHNWQTAFNGTSNQTADDFSRHQLEAGPFRYMRIVCNGNNLHSWSSIWEVRCPAD